MAASGSSSSSPHQLRRNDEPILAPQAVRDNEHPLAFQVDGPRGEVVNYELRREGQVLLAHPVSNDGRSPGTPLASDTQQRGPVQPFAFEPANAAAPLPAQDATDQAIQVRTNAIRSIWSSYQAMNSRRRWLFLSRLFIGVVQIIPSIVILALPTSLGNSAGREPGTVCDPEPIFVYLALHILRVAVSIPTDLYLCLSPHRSSRQRRFGSNGFEEREGQRRIGSYALDTRLGRVQDLLNFIHLVIFALGNYAVWSNTECGTSPADSVPLFWTAFAMLSVTYLLIIFFVLLLLMVVFFLPLLLAGMRAVGLGHRIPQPRIRPSTAKIPQNEVEKVTKLVYYLPEEEVAAPLSKPRSSLDELRVAEREASIPGASQDTREASGVMLPPSRPPTPAARRSGEQSASSNEPSKPTVTLTEEPEQLASAGWKRFAGAVLPRRRRKVAAAATTTNEAASEAAGTKQLKYPLLRIPAHRATCPICLCDFEPPDTTTASSATTNEHNDDQAAAPPEPEVLRLLPCGHVLHAACVDQWLTTVSARCPVCQKKLVETPGNNATDEEEQ